MFHNNQPVSWMNVPALNTQSPGLFGANGNSNTSFLNQGLQTPQKQFGLNGNFNGNQNQAPPNGTFGFKFDSIRVDKDKDSSNMMSISFVPQFERYSFEELKFMDYELKKKGMVNNINQQGGNLIGNTGNFNSQYASGTLFGQQQQQTSQQSSNLFGQTQQGAFGNTLSMTAPNGLGNTQQTNTGNGLFNTTGSSFFGTSQQGGGLFGSNSATGQNSSSSFLGNTQPALFGNNNLQAPLSMSGLFGTQPNQTQSNHLFNNGTNSSFIGGSGTSSLFEKGNNSLLNTQSTQQSSLFGSTLQQTNNNQSTGSSLFGKGTSNGNAASNNLFSAQNNQQQSLFNNLQGNTVTLFANPPQTQQQPSSNTSLFGNSGTGQSNQANNLFSSVLTSTPALFTSKPGETGSLFNESSPAGNTSLFSSMPTQSSQNTQLNAPTPYPNQMISPVVQLCPVGIDLSELPEEIVEAMKQQKDINQIKKELEEKYDNEIRGSLLFNQLTSIERRYERDCIPNDGPDFARDYLKTKYAYPLLKNNKREVKIKIRPIKYGSKVTSNGQTLTSHHFPIRETKEKWKEDISNNIPIPSSKLLVKINTKQCHLHIPNQSISILDLKHLIKRTFLPTVPVGELSLFSKNQYLSEQKTLDNYNIDEYSLIEVIQKGDQVFSKASEVARVEEIPKISVAKYKITPEYKDLCRMSTEELRHVRNFSISNEYGSIKFLKEVNLLGLNLDSIITIAPLKVQIYNHHNPPPKGEQLNVSKEITINHFFISPDEEEDLKLHLKDSKAQLISYDGLNGVLVFRED